MRTTLLGSLLDVARYNLARGAERVALFESGRVYLRDGDADRRRRARRPVRRRARRRRSFEPHRIGCLAIGPPPGGGWRGEPGEPDFFALKGVLEALAAAARRRARLRAGERAVPAPGPRRRAVIVAGAAAGWIGELHPLVCRAWDLDAAAGFEVDLAPLVAASPVGEESYEDVTTYPGRLPGPRRRRRRGRRRRAVRARGPRRAAASCCASAEVFDLYEGEQLGEGRKSLALRLEFRAADRTLTDEEVAELRERDRGGAGGDRGVAPW